MLKLMLVRILTEVLLGFSEYFLFAVVVPWSFLQIS